MPRCRSPVDVVGEGMARRYARALAEAGAGQEESVEGHTAILSSMWCNRYGGYIGSSDQYCLDVTSFCVALRTTECPRSVRFSTEACMEAGEWWQACMETRRVEA